MNRSVRLTMVLVVVACLAAAVLKARRPRPQPVSAIVIPPPPRGEVVRARLESKTRVIDRLMQNELTLAEAAAWFRYLNDNPPEYPCDYRRGPGASDGERLCRQVISWADARAVEVGGHSQADHVRWRLEHELKRLLSRDGTVELPW